MHEPGAEWFRPIRRGTLAHARGAVNLLATAALLAIASCQARPSPSTGTLAEKMKMGWARQPKLAKEFSPLTTHPAVFRDAYTPANYGTDAQTSA